VLREIDVAMDDVAGFKIHSLVKQCSTELVNIQRKMHQEGDFLAAQQLFEATDRFSQWSNNSGASIAPSWNTSLARQIRNVPYVGEALVETLSLIQVFLADRKQGRLWRR
jgi:hypothetical protein